MTNHAATQPEAKAESHIRLPTCRFCHGRKVIKRGQRRTQWRGKIKRYECKTCERTFTIDDGFLRMRHAPENITRAIDLYFANLSSRKVRNHYRRHHETTQSHVTVLDWCRRYVLKVHKYTDTLKPTLSGAYYMDETTILCGGRKDWLWVAIDWGTRFIPNIHYSLFSDKNNCTKFLQSIKEKNVPKYIQTDSAGFYEGSFKAVFTNGEVDHRMNNVQKTGKHNVRIETVFMKIKDRVYDFRGLKAAWSAPILLTGIVVQHNWIEPHTTTGKLPAELAGINDGNNGNRWLELIHRAAATA